MEGVEVFSNWKFDNEDKLNNLITLVSSAKNEGGLEYVDIDSCVCLTKNDSDTLDSKPELEIKSKHLINKMRVISEGSLIEVFGINDEYLFTCVPEFVDDWQGMAVYNSEIILSEIRTCKLRFSKIKEKGRLWLYSIQLSVTESEDLKNSSVFNFENINNLLNNSSHQISEKAEKFKRLFELYGTNSSSSQSFIIPSMLNIINRECNSQFSDYKKILMECVNSSNFTNISESVNAKNENRQVSKKELSPECLYLKNYIDNKFAEMREDLMKCLSTKLKEYNEENSVKLNKIIKSLEALKL